MRIKTKEFEIVEIGVEKDVDLGYGIKDCLLPNLVLCGGGGGELFYVLFNVVQVDDIISRFYMGHLSMKAKFNIGRVMSLKWSHVR